MIKNNKFEWFFNWIEIFLHGKKRYLFLTVANAFDSSGCNKEFPSLNGFYDNPNRLLSHDAIRKCFKLEKGEGIEKSAKMFWQKKSFYFVDSLGKEVEIKEITDKIDNFDVNFKKFLEKGCFSDGQLCFIIKEAPEEWKWRAWNQLLAQNSKPERRPFLLRYLSSLFEHWFIVHFDTLGKSITATQWKEIIAEKILEIRLEQVREIYNHIYDHIIYSYNSSSYFRIYANPWDFELLGSLLRKDKEKTVSKTKLELMINYYKGKEHSINQSLDFELIMVKDLWDLCVIERVFGEYDAFSKNSKLIITFFSIINALLNKP